MKCKYYIQVTYDNGYDALDTLEYSEELRTVTFDNFEDAHNKALELEENRYAEKILQYRDAGAEYQILAIPFDEKI